MKNNSLELTEYEQNVLSANADSVDTENPDVIIKIDNTSAEMSGTTPELVYALLRSIETIADNHADRSDGEAVTAFINALMKKYLAHSLEIMEQKEFENSEEVPPLSNLGGPIPFEKVPKEVQEMIRKIMRDKFEGDD
ncbi:hypothetical protein FEZ51_01950 [Pediococcus stilesii]|uniref:Uncharacterized protein n=1 Tax=Pediococcus stilesii TaxID=331679 RepID=A0A5R9BXK3_9LACO|nr:hypothetical protein [Pediococcus stilesii]TLQ05446.1 hypothetical protein FEZ51_01950 [Pediococcus stilesii]